MKYAIFWIIIVAILFAIFTVIPGELADQNKAIRLLQNQGFSNIEIINRDIWWMQFKGGSKEDSALFTINAINPSGQEVIVHVFVGWPWKGATLRGY